MESGSESAAEKVGPTLSVGPTEDVVQALMETLLDPFLPLRVSSIFPSENVEIAVAKQMHAVVLLYNYYHRKQKPELVFIEFVDFCKLAIVIRPPLIAFMKLMKGCTLQELNEIEDLLSVTEKSIKDACDIARGLDASRDVPNMEGWPISKVAVVLIDSKKENCMFLEKELNESSLTAKMSVGNEVGNKRKRDDLKVSTCNTEFLQLGYDAVKDITGFSFSELEVLETHITYSVSKQKSAACLYIMQCPGLLDEHNQVSLKFLVESVQGPLAEKFANGLWRSTALVKLHQKRPYMELIMCWFSGCDPEMKYSEPKASSVDIFQSTEKDADLTNKIFKRFETLDHAESSQNRILENLEYDGSLSSSPSRVVSEMVMKEDNIMEFGKGCDVADHDAGHSAVKDERRICPEILDEDRIDCGKEVLSGTEDNKTRNTNIKVYHHWRNKNSSLENVIPLQEAVPCPEVAMVDALESIESEKVPGDEDCLTDMCNQSDTASNGDLRAQLQAKTGNRDYTQKCSHPCTAATGNQPTHVEAGIEQNVDVESTLDSLRSDHNQTRDENLSRDKGDQILEGNHTCIAATGNQQSEVEAEMMPNMKVQSNSSSLDYIQSRDEKLSIEKDDHIYKCNHTGVVATQNQLPQLDAKSTHGVEANTISASDQQQNALALLYRKRQELYSQICNMEDKLALCEDYVARIRDCGEVALARQCIKSVLSGTFHSLLEKGTQVQNKGNQQDANDKSQHGNPTKLSEAYITGKSSSQDLEYTCMRNNWRLPRYLTESSNGKFLSKVVVEGKEFKLHAKGGFESTPYKARETAAAQMITVMHATFL